MKRILFLILSVYLPVSLLAQQPDQSKDSAIREKLVALALINPDIKIADANIKVAELGLRRSKTIWLNSLTAGGNVNEFVITNSAAASFFPKYNFGVSVPFDIFSRSNFEKKTAQQNIIIGRQVKEGRIREIRADVLTKYENYKEKKELLRLQKIAMEPDYQAYIAAQKNYEDGSIKIDEMNKVYQVYVNEQAKLVSKEKDLNISIIQLESLIGTPLDGVLKDFQDTK